METKQYSDYLQAKLIQDFRKMFFEKTGLQCNVMVDDGKEGILFMSLDELERHINLFISPMEIPMKTTIRSKTRTTNLAYLRFVFFQIARGMGYSLKEIGKQVNRHHTTVIHGLKAAQDLIDTGDDFFIQMLFQIKTHLKKLHSYEPAISDPDQVSVNTESVVPALLP